MVKLFSLLSAVALIWMGIAAAEEQSDHSGDIDNEISRLRKEIQQLQTQRRNNRSDMESEQRDVAAYRERHEKRLAESRAENDSLKRETIQSQKRSDSLASLIHAAQVGKHEIELSTEALRLRLASSCDAFDTLAARLPPLSQGQIRSSIALVKNDLANKTIECPEAFNRLAQIVSLMRDVSGSIQTTGGASPIPDIIGSVVQLRIGSIMAAVADSKGSVCYVWAGNNANGTPQWKAVDDKSIATEIVHGVAVREGKALPALIRLPLTASQNGVAP